MQHDAAVVAAVIVRHLLITSYPSAAFLVVSALLIVLVVLNLWAVILLFGIQVRPNIVTEFVVQLFLAIHLPRRLGRLPSPSRAQLS